MNTKYTLVEMVLPIGWHGIKKAHSALKIHSVSDKSASKILEAGGYIGDLKEALAASQKFMEAPKGMLPDATAHGKFHPKMKLGGERVFLPNKKGKTNE